MQMKTKRWKKNQLWAQDKEDEKKKGRRGWEEAARHKNRQKYRRGKKSWQCGKDRVPGDGQGGTRTKRQWGNSAPGAWDSPQLCGAARRS